MHGLLAHEGWQPPRMVAYAAVEARPGYNSCNAHEYIDEPETLAAKVQVLARLIRRSRNCIAYTGAGISTASGINDYASVAVSSVTGGQQHKSPVSHMLAEPTLAHRVLTSVYHAGLMKQWIQQNHDGLPQKAGFPQHALNEIHGAWFDPSNPVVKMEGELRSDLYASLLEWEQRADLCLAIGTTLAGMNADRVAATPAAAAVAGVPGALGLVIINLQQTQMDEQASLRIFAKIDDVMEALARELGLTPATPPDFRRSAAAAVAEVATEVVADNETPLAEQHWIKYGSDGLPLDAGEPLRLLDMSEGARVRILSGPYAGDEGELLGRSRMGHYQIRFMHTIQQRTPFRVEGVDTDSTRGNGSWLAPMTHTLGAWMVNEAVQGLLPSFPFESVSGDEPPSPPSPSQDEHQECVAAGATAAGLPDWVKESYLKAGKGIPQQPKPYVGYGCD